MISRLLYELKPHACLLSGCLLLSTTANPFFLSAGLLLFGSGSILWVLRSEYRRTDEPHFIPANELLIYPPWLYEFLPFIYILTGIGLIRYNSTQWFVISGSAFIFWALYCLIKRTSHRQPIRHPRQRIKI